MSDCAGFRLLRIVCRRCHERVGEVLDTHPYLSLLVRTRGSDTQALEPPPDLHGRDLGLWWAQHRRPLLRDGGAEALLALASAEADAQGRIVAMCSCQQHTLMLRAVHKKLAEGRSTLTV
jgi:hypothetical protein